MKNLFVLSLKHIFYIAIISFSLGCEKLRVSSRDMGDIPVSTNSYALSDITSTEILERAWQMANVIWTPVNPVPQRFEEYYGPGITVKGIPYSSVKEINTYLFQDVSYHTFMTAVHNPKSVLYTENVSEPPYHGLNCAPYYGGVCSSTVMYALGISIPYYANQIIDLPFMHKLKYQVVDSLMICDVIWKPGHVQMVFDIEHRADTLYKISLFEASGKSAHISNYTAKGFKQLWSDSNYEAYRRESIIYTDRPVSFAGFEPVEYNDDLCPSKGDMSVYKTDDPILINIFNSGYQEIVFMKDDAVVLSTNYNDDVYQFSAQEPGIYYCYLQAGNVKSKTVSFEIIATDVDVSLISKEKLLIRFYSNAMPDYVAICDINGNSEYYPISESDRLMGYIVVPRPRYSDYYCKVIFKGEYGTIANRPIRV